MLTADDVVTERLVLHPLAADEARRILDGTPAAVDRWHPEYPFVDELDALRPFVAAGGASGPFGLFQIRTREPDEAVGGIGFFGPPDENGIVEVGYGLVAAARGLGYATEAVRAVVDFAAANGARAIKADTELTNAASQRVLAKSGFRRTAAPAGSAPDERLAYFGIELGAHPPRALGTRTDLAVLAAEGSDVRRMWGGWMIETPENRGFRWGNCLVLDEPPLAYEVEPLVTAFHDRFPTADYIAVGIDAGDGVFESAEAWTEAGFEVQRAVVLSAWGPLEPPPRPAPAETVRVLESDADWAGAEALSVAESGDEPQAEYATFMHARTLSRRRLTATGAAAWFGAFDGDQLVAAMGIVRVDAGLARYQHVETRESHRRRGLASALLVAASRFAVERLGAAEIVIIADEDSDALRLYRSLGFVDREVQLQLERVRRG